MHPLADSVADELALHLGHGCQYREDQSTGGRVRVELRLRERLKPDIVVFEVAQRGEGVEGRAKGSIELPDQDPIDAAPCAIVEEPCPSLSVREIAGGRRIDVLQRLPAPGPDVLPHRLELQLGILVLIPGRNPGVQRDTKRRNRARPDCRRGSECVHDGGPGSSPHAEGG